MKNSNKTAEGPEEMNSEEKNSKTVECFVGKLFGFSKSSHEFCLSSFIGGLAFGAGLSLVVTKTIRAIFLSASSGICLLMLTNKYGYIKVDWDKICNYMKDHFESSNGFVKSLNDFYEVNKMRFFNTFLCNSLTESQLSSATSGVITGFTFGLIFL